MSISAIIALLTSLVGLITIFARWGYDKYKKKSPAEAVIEAQQKKRDAQSEFNRDVTKGNSNEIRQDFEARLDNIDALNKLYGKTDKGNGSD